MARQKKKALYEYCGLEDCLKNISTPKWKSNHNGRTFWEAYEQIVLNLKPVQENVTSGAMAEGIRSYIEKCKTEIEKIKESGGDIEESINKLLSSDNVIFLNDHGPEHIQKVISRAFEILKNSSQEINEFELFILLCSIQIHDIGNILGRVGHERKLLEIFEEKCQNIIMDRPERRVIKSIAMAHGGKAPDGSKDTISKLTAIEPVLDSFIRTRYLAAILRFADELADDYSRANRVALDLGIIGIDSQIYHDYSQALHTVKIQKDSMNNDYQIVLVYELDTSMLKKEYTIGVSKKYLLDEIYDRTLKMEQERRYCMKFMHPYIDISKVDVKINIYDEDLRPLRSISYTLEDILYPDNPQIGHIKDIDEKIPAGKEMLEYITNTGDDEND